MTGKDELLWLLDRDTGNLAVANVRVREVQAVTVSGLRNQRLKSTVLLSRSARLSPVG